MCSRIVSSPLRASALDAGVSLLPSAVRNACFVMLNTVLLCLSLHAKCGKKAVEVEDPGLVVMAQSYSHLSVYYPMIG